MVLSGMLVPASPFRGDYALDVPRRVCLEKDRQAGDSDDSRPIGARRLLALPVRSISCGMKGEGDDDRYSEEETARRAEEVIKRMINTPPKPRSPPPQKSKRRAASKGRVHKGKTRN